MPGTTPNNGFRIPLATEPPDAPGQILQLATDLDNALVLAGTWIPQLGGGSGATVGANAIAEGSFTRIGKHVAAKGRLVFGSTASFGSGAATIAGLPNTMVAARSAGHGHYVSGTSIIPVTFLAVDGANFQIRPLQGNTGNATGSYAFSLGTPAQSTELRFAFDMTTT